jgi:RNAse (barnase) inhibitor barstar
MNEKLAELFVGATAPGIYRFDSRAGVPAITAHAERSGWRVFHLDGRQVATKDDFLAACAKAMSFPRYFGHNWDALEDCLRDLSWAPARYGYLVLYEDPRNFNAARPDEFAVALNILASAVEFWRETPTPMAVLLQRAGRGTRRVPRL